MIRPCQMGQMCFVRCPECIELDKTIPGWDNNDEWAEKYEFEIKSSKKYDLTVIVREKKMGSIIDCDPGVQESIREYKERQERKMKTLNKSELHKLLTEGVVDVRFTKVNGETRNMKATLDIGRIPEDKIPKPQVLNEYDESPIKPRKENPGVLRVFDTEIEEWRSFRLDSVNEINGEEKKILTE